MSTIAMRQVLPVVRSFIRSLNPWLRSSSFLSTSSAKDTPAFVLPQKTLRNVGISAHVDSGKTTLTERILFFTGRIKAIHEVRGNDGVGAKMDSMDLERERGITIKSAATSAQWSDHHLNIIDTPGHCDFQIEVERALRVLDGAVLVICCVGGVQSQTITVNRQMNRYKVPRICFINKLDRFSADPFKIIEELREGLGRRTAPVQIPIGVEDQLEGLVDLLRGKALYFDGMFGENIREGPIPERLQSVYNEKRRELIETLADVDDSIAEYFLAEEEPPLDHLTKAIRSATISLKFVPIFMGSAYKNKGVQPLLDGIIDYLPSPGDVSNTALDLKNDEAETELESSVDKALVALAFKLEENRFGQLTYMRVYQGIIKRGDVLYNVSNNNKEYRVPRLVRMHSDEMEDIQGAGAGDVIAMFGIECNSGSTFTDGVQVSLTSMHIPDTVMEFAIKPKSTTKTRDFIKGLARFQREDPTFQVRFDADSDETIIAGMGELHLQIYIERMLREYSVETIVSPPRVNYRESITKRMEFDYLHKKQTGGAGQYGRIIGYAEPMDPNGSVDFEFVNAVAGNNIMPEHILGVERGFRDAVKKGLLIGAPLKGIRVVLQDGQSHLVDSTEMAFRNCAERCFRQLYSKLNPHVLEPIMDVTVEVPDKNQGAVVGSLTKRKGLITSSDAMEGGLTKVCAQVPLSRMFGYSSELRSGTEGKGEFSMTYVEHRPVFKEVQKELEEEYQRKRQEK